MAQTATPRGPRTLFAKIPQVGAREHIRHQKEPRYNAISYTWGRWELKDRLTRPDVTSLKILGVSWSVPRICASHFTVAELTQAIRRAAEPPEHD